MVTEVRVYRVTRARTMAQAGRYLDPGDLVELEVAQALTTFRTAGLVDAETGDAVLQLPLPPAIAAMADPREQLRAYRAHRLSEWRAHLTAGGRLPDPPTIPVPLRIPDVEGLLKPLPGQHGWHA